MAGAVIKIGANTNDFQRQINEVNKQLKVTTSQFGVTAKQAELFGKNTDKLKAQQQELTTKITSQNKVIDLYKQKMTSLNADITKQKATQTELSKNIAETTKKYNESVKATGEESKQSQALKKELEGLAKQYNQNEKDIDRTNKQLDDSVMKMNNTKKSVLENEKALKDLNKELGSAKIDAFTEKMDKVSKKTGEWGKSLTTKVTLPVVGLGTFAGKSAIDFESAFTGVRKTVNGTEEDFTKLEKGIRDMSKSMPQSAVEISGVAEAAGQLGIKVENIESFTKSMIMLGDSTNMSSEDAATALARLANITGMPQTEFDKLGSVVVALGNNLATTESDITNMGLRLAGAGTQIGLSEAQIMSFAGALSSVGIEAEAGGSAFSKVMIEMQLAVEKGGKDLNNFAKVSGMSSKEFQKAFKDDASKAMMSFIEGLGKSEERGISVIKVLDDMGITEVRLRDSLLRASGASDVFTQALGIGNEAWEENTALTKEAETRYGTTESQMAMLKNKVSDLGITFGQIMLPTIRDVVDIAGKLLEKFSGLDEGVQKNIISTALIVAALGPVLLIFSKTVSGISKMINGVSKFIDGVKKIPGAVSKAGKAIRTFGGHIANGVKAIGGFIKQSALMIKNIVTMGVKAAWTGTKFVLLKLKTAALTVVTWLQTAATAALNFIMSLNPITLVILGIIALIAIIATLWTKSEGFRNFVTKMWTDIQASFNNFNDFLTGIFNKDWTESFGAFGNILNGFFVTVGGVWDSIKQVFRGIVEFVSGVFQGDWSRAWEGVKNIFGGIFNGLVAIAKAPINAVIGLLNFLIDKINSISFDIPDWVPIIGGGNFSFNVPRIGYLENGGILTRPTFAGGFLAGESNAGRKSQAEAVIPLDVMYRKIDNIVANRLNNPNDNQIVYVTSITNLDGREVARSVERINKGKQNNYNVGRGRLV